MYCIYGAEADVFINFMWSMFLSNGCNFPFIFIFKVSPTDGQVWLWHCGLPVGPQSLCSWRYLIFYVQYLIYTKIFDFTRWHVICMFVGLNTCIGPSTRWDRCILRERVFCSITYLDLAQDKGMLQSSSLARL